MKYYKVTFKVNPCTETNTDVLSALLAEVGFETFMPCDEGMEAYIQQAFLDNDALKENVDNFPLPDTTIQYNIEEAPDQDWNETWEAEGFEPVEIGNIVCVHDTKHEVKHNCHHDIIINPRMAFGTGTHPTTQMILSHLTTLNLEGLRLVDAGCGTGVLGILALQCGAKEVLGYDIDEWSVENSEINAMLNGVAMRVRHGDVSALDGETDFDVLVANINRNILLNDLHCFAKALRPQSSRLIISGFYTEDAAQLIKEAEKNEFTLATKHELDGWCMLEFTR